MHKTAENTGVTCQFMHVHELVAVTKAVAVTAPTTTLTAWPKIPALDTFSQTPVKMATGGRPSADVHLDRMAENTGMSARFSHVAKPLPQGASDGVTYTLTTWPPTWSP